MPFDSGEIQWKLNVVGDLEGTEVGFGYSASPIAYEDTIIIPVGGKGHSVVALNASTGQVVWSSQDFDNSYSTPVLASVEGQDQLILAMTDQVISINPGTGELFWEFPLTNQWSTHCFVPVWNPENQTLFVSSFSQSHLLKLVRDGDGFSTETVWSNMKRGIGFSNAVRIGDVLYGSTGSQRASIVTAIRLSDGEYNWQQRGFGLCNFLASGNRLLLMDENGVFVLAEPGEDELGEILRKKILNGPKAWTAPAISGDVLFARDRKDIVAVQLK